MRYSRYRIVNVFYSNNFFLNVGHDKQQSVAPESTKWSDTQLFQKKKNKTETWQENNFLQLSVALREEKVSFGYSKCSQHLYSIISVSERHSPCEGTNNQSPINRYL